MTPQTDDGRHYQGAVATDEGDATLAAVAADAQTAAFDIEDATALVATLDITAKGGTAGALDVALQGRVDDGPWTEIAAFAQVDDVEETKRAFPVAGWDEGRWDLDITAGTTPTITHATTQAGGGGSDEVQTITFAHASGGTFTVTFDGQTTAALAYGITAAALKTALEGLSNIEADDLTVDKAGDVYTVTFGGTLADTNVAQMTSSAASLVGAAFTGTIAVDKVRN